MTCRSSRNTSTIAAAGGAVVILFAGLQTESQEPPAQPDAGRQVEQDQQSRNRQMPDLPISQISIELYKPLPGGAFLGERLAPESFDVPYMRDYTPDDVE